MKAWLIAAAVMTAVAVWVATAFFWWIIAASGLAVLALAVLTARMNRRVPVRGATGKDAGDG